MEAGRTHAEEVARPVDEGAPPRGPEAYVAELIGTFTLVFFIAMVVSLTAPDPIGLGVADFAVIGLVHLFVLAMLIHALGSTSGAHFNPAVTFALTAIGKIRPAQAGVYVAVQVVGAVLAVLVVKLLIDDAGDAASYGATLIAEDRFLEGSAGKGLVAEFIGTFFLMWAIMAMAVNPRSDRDWAGFIIGATLALAVLVMAPLTGAGFNPARSFGPALVSGEWADFWVYVVAPLLGAPAAAFAYRAIVLAPQHRLEYAPVTKLP